MSTETLRNVLSQFMNETLSPERFAEMRVVVETWGKETGHFVYPILVRPSSACATHDGPVLFDVTFECVPKA